MRGAAERLASLRRERARRSEEHTSELQSQSNLVCRLLLEKKNGLPLAAPLSPTAAHHATCAPRAQLPHPPRTCPLRHRHHSHPRASLVDTAPMPHPTTVIH